MTADSSSQRGSEAFVFNIYLSCACVSKLSSTTINHIALFCMLNSSSASELSSYPEYFREPLWKSMALPEISRALQWRHDRHDGVSNHQPHGSLLNRLFRRRSKKTTKLRVTGLCARNSPVPDEFPAQRASNVENVSIWWCHHEIDSSDVFSWLPQVHGVVRRRGNHPGGYWNLIQVWKSRKRRTRRESGSMCASQPTR